MRQNTRSLTREPLAHLTEDGRPHLLIEHLTAVADQARRFGEVFGAEERVSPPSDEEGVD